MAADTSASVDNKVPIKRDKFVCIEYPGRVENVDRMLETLGEEENISKTIAEKNKRIELRFRPEDPYCKPVCANLYPTNNLLVRVKRRYRKPKSTATAGKDDEKSSSSSSSSTSSSSQDAEYKTEVLGVVESTYRFTGMCDFQYLPMGQNSAGKMESLIDKIIPTELDEKKYFAQEMPYHLQPPSFSRTDIPSDYHYKPDQIQHRPSYPPIVDPVESNLIGRNRARRPHNAYLVPFDRKEVPAEAHPNALRTKERYKNVENKLEELKALFEERPMWSKNALKGRIELTLHQFKVLLPLVAYYFITGPWRAIWCRLGYDPRKSADGKQYQMLDFRLRKVMVGVGKGVIKAKRSTYMYRLPITIRRPQPPQAVTVGKKAKEQEETVPKEAYYVFRRGLVPAYHQMFYQLCDLKDDELQEIIHCNDGREKEWTERNGWLEPHVLGELRDRITDMLKETLNNLGDKGHDGNSSEQPSTSLTGGEGDEGAVGGVDEEEEEDDEDEDQEDDDAMDQGGEEDDEKDDEDDDEEEEEDEDDINDMEMEMLELIDPAGEET